jgi:hypothetical protein
MPVHRHSADQRRKSVENTLLCGPEPNLSIIGLWFEQVRTCALDSLVCFNLYSSGHGLVYYIDEVNVSLQLAYKIQLSVENFPGENRVIVHQSPHNRSASPSIDLVETTGALCSMKWTPDYRVLCTLWQNGAYAIWTVFGILLHCSHSSEYSL